MAMQHGGLAKLVEESGEVIQIAGKMIQYPNTDEHPDGGGSMKVRLEDELADLTAAATFVAAKLNLDTTRIETRLKQKLELFTLWDQQA